MMRPSAATAYLPAQNAVADDFLLMLHNSLDETGEIPDFYNVILKYAMEGTFMLHLHST